MKEQRLKFLETIFDDGDLIAFGKDKASAYRAVDPFPAFLHTDASMFCINPIKKFRATRNVTRINSLLFEVDNDEQGNPVPIEEQKSLFLESGLPFTSMTYSGNKSMHVIVRFTEPIEDPQWQKQWWRAISAALKKNGINADKSTAAVPQLSRVPYGISDKTGKVQTLEILRDRVSQFEMSLWLSMNGIEVEEPKSANVDWRPVNNTGWSELQKFRLAVKWCSKDEGEYNSQWNTGGHNWMWTLGLTLWKIDADPKAAVRLAELEWGQTYSGQNGVGRIADTILRGWKWGSENKKAQVELK